jgi:hypothetical protein
MITRSRPTEITLHFPSSCALVCAQVRVLASNTSGAEGGVGQIEVRMSARAASQEALAAISTTVRSGFARPRPLHGRTPAGGASVHWLSHALASPRTDHALSASY